MRQHNSKQVPISKMASKTQLVCVCAVLVSGLIVPLLIAQAQKTASGSNYRQTSSFSSSAGSAPQSVYGGYGSSQSNRRVTKQQVVNRPVQPVVQQQQQQQDSYYSESSSQQQSEADAEPASYGSVAGQPGRDFPAYTQVPKTSFSCDGLPYEYGMYADEETNCQAYHVCYNGRKDSFLCGVGTVFNQRILHCDYWYSVDCAKSSQYYSSNEYMGSSQPEPGPAQAAGSSYKRTESSSVQSTALSRPASPVNNYQRTNSFSRNTQQQQVQEPY